MKVPKELLAGSREFDSGARRRLAGGEGSTEGSWVANGTLQRNLSPPLRSACGPYQGFAHKETEGELGKIYEDK